MLIRITYDGGDYVTETWKNFFDGSFMAYSWVKDTKVIEGHEF